MASDDVILSPTRTLDSLPYNNLEWRRFELFVAELVGRLPEFDFVQNYGASPDTQLGIDILASRDLERWAFQCKRVQQFGVADFHKALKAAGEFEAAAFVLVLSCRARTALIDSVNGAGWKLWDSDELDRRIRGIDDAYDFVNGYFGRAVATAFLGKRTPGVFLTPTEFFSPLLDAERVDNMSIEFVDRGDELAAMRDFENSAASRVLIVSAPAGAGKSRLLYEFSKSLSNSDDSVLFVREASDLDDDTIEELPRDTKVIAVDNIESVHRIDNLYSHVARSPRLKLILTIRSGHEVGLSNQLQEYGYDRREIEFVALKGLSRANSMLLASSLLPGTPRPALELVYRVSSGNPLAIEVAAFLLRQGDKAFIDSISELQYPINVLLAKYSEVVAGRATEDQLLSRDELVSAMQLFSAVCPVDVRTAEFRDRATRFLNWDASKLRQATAALQSARVLVKSGSRTNLVPDLLRMVILQEACAGGAVPSDFATRIVSQFGYDRQLLLNLATIDRMVGQEYSVLDPVWIQLELDLRRATSFERVMLLDGIADLGYILPGRALELVEFLIYNPAPPDPEQPLRQLHEFKHENVLDKLSPMLRAVAYSAPHLVRRCVQLLWMLGRDEDDRVLRDGAFSTLVNMARYGRYKSVTMNLDVLTEVEQINEAPDAQTHRHLPIEVVAPVLVKTFDSYEESGARFSVRKLPVAGKNVAAVRAKALDILAASLFGESSRAGVRAVEYLVECLRHAEFGTDSESERIWAAEQARVLDLLEQARRADTHGLLQAKIGAALQWHAQVNASAEVRTRSAAIIAGLEGEPAFDWYASLIPDVARSLPSTNVRATLEEQQVVIDALLQRVVSRTIADSDPPHFSADLARSITEIDAAGLHGGAGWLMIELAKRDLPYAKRTADTIVSTFGSILGDAIAPIITMTWQLDQAWTKDIIELMLRSDEQRLYIALARGLWMIKGAPGPRDYEVTYRSSIIAELIRLGNEAVREIAFHAVTTLMSVDKPEAIKLVVNSELGADKKIADELFATLRTTSLENLGPDAITKLLNYMVRIEEVEYWGFEFLQRLASEDSARVLDMFMRRIEAADANEDYNANFRAVPYGQAVLPNVVQFFEKTTFSVDAVRDALDRGFRLSPKGRFWFSELLSNVAIRANVVFDALKSWGYDDDRERVKFVADAMRRVPSQAIFENIPFVSAIADAAAELGKECEKRVHGAIFSAAISGMRTGIPFQPMSQDVLMIESAQAARVSLTPGTPADRLFETSNAMANRVLHAKKKRISTPLGNLSSAYARVTSKVKCGTVFEGFAMN